MIRGSIKQVKETHERIRELDQRTLYILTKDMKIPKKHFLSHLKGQEDNPRWVQGFLAEHTQYQAVFDEHNHSIVRVQKGYKRITRQYNESIGDIKQTIRTITQGEVQTRQAKDDMIQANLRLVISLAKKIYQQRLTVLRSYPRG